MLKLLPQPYGLIPTVADFTLPKSEASLEDSTFLSHAWLRSCLESWSDQATFRVLRLGSNSESPVIALIGERVIRRHGVLPVHVLALNQSVHTTLDEPWIERNGFFGCSPARFEEHLIQLLDALSDDTQWDELRLSGLTSTHARQAILLATHYGLRPRLDHDSPSFLIDLQAVRDQHGGDYLQALSPNTRQQLRRSRRMAQDTLGPLKLEMADSVEQALDWFEQTAPLHRMRWDTPHQAHNGRGFDNPDFVRFHQSLIRHAFPEGGIQFLRLRAGHTVLAYLYNFVTGENVHFYMSGINYQLEPNLRPGMLAHWMAIEASLTTGKRSYDFLAGDARYKRSLSTAEDKVLWLVLQRPRLKLQVETWVRKAKRQWLGQPQDNLALIPFPNKIR
jgi:hypothetical protein